jgi:hypothetical protein
MHRQHRFALRHFGHSGFASPHDLHADRSLRLGGRLCRAIGQCVAAELYWFRVRKARLERPYVRRINVWLGCRTRLRDQ